MSTVEALTCSVCAGDAEDAIECDCGAVYCHECQDGHECVYEEIFLRSYQEELRDGTYGLIRIGHRIILDVLPTGGGKRLVFAWLAKRAALIQGKRVLFCVNRRPLVMQMSKELKKRGVPHNITMGAETTADCGELVTVASIQTLRKRHFFHPDTGKLDGTGLPEADLVLIDEAHLDLRSYKTLFHFYPRAVILGNTATPIGPGGKSLGDVWPAMYIGAPKSELIKGGYLVPTKMYSPSEPNMQGVRITNKDAVEKRTRQCTIFANVFHEWQPWSDLPTVVFAPGVDFAEWMSQEWNKRGYRAVCVSQKTTTKERDRIFNAVTRGDIRVTVSVDVLKVGVDVPAWKCAVDCQVTKQLRDFLQKAGRICRKTEDDEEAVYLDFSGAFWRFGHPDEDIAWDDLRGSMTTEELVAKARKKPESPEPIACPKCHFVRRFGPKCPQCGFECGHVVRLVQMEDGRLRRMILPKKKDAKEPAGRGTPEFQIKNWIGCLFQATRGKRQFTLRQARKFYFDKVGEWPPDTIPGMPPRDSSDWDRKVCDVYEWDRGGKTWVRK